MRAKRFIASLVMLMTGLINTPVLADGSGVPALTFQPNELLTPLRTFTTSEIGARPTFAGMHKGYLIIAGGGVGGEPRALTLWDIANPSAPTLFSSTPDNTIFKTHAMGFSGDLVTVRAEGGVLYDLTDPANPLRRGTMGGIASSLWAYYAAPYIYKGGEGYDSASGWVTILDASNPDNIVVVNELNMPALVGFRCGSTHVLGNLLVVSASQTNGVVTFDISDPVNPVLLDVLRIPGDITYNSLLVGNRLYSGGSTGGLHVYDLTDPSNIVHVGNVQPGGTPRYPLLQDEYIHLGNLGNDTYQKIDIDRMQLAASAPMPGGPLSDPEIALPMGNLVFIGNSVLDVNLPGGYLMAHDTDPDTRGMIVNAVRPVDGETQVASTSMIGVALSDQIDPRTVGAASFIVRPVGGSAIAGTYTTQTGTINFVPDQPLTANTTYEVVIPRNGVRDLSGNDVLIESVTRFSTGSTVAGSAPQAPDNLTAVAINNSQVDLSWSDNSSTETSFLIERKTALGPYLPLAETAANSTAFSDTTAEPFTNYVYRISARNSASGGGNSATSPIAFVTTPGASANSNLLAHWRFDNDTSDDSGNGSVAVLQGNAAFSTDRQIGSHSVDLDGFGDFVTTGNFDLGDRFSISMWAKIAPGSSDIQTLAANTQGGGPPSNGFRFFVNEYQTGNGSIRFETHNATVGDVAFSPTGTFVFDQWNHVTVTVDTTVGAARIYYNGSDVTTSSSMVTGFDTVGALELGRMLGFFELNGNLDDVRIYDDVLTAFDIAQLASPGAPNAPSGLNATSPSSTEVDLVWTDNSNNETEFQVERRLGAGAFIQVAALAPNTTSFQDSGLSPSSQYTYRVRASNVNGDSAYSNAATTITSSGTSAPGLVAHWEMDNSGLSSAAGGNTGNALGGAAYTTDAAIGSHGLSLDGFNDYFDGGAMTLAESFTISMWVKIDPGSFNIQTLAANTTGGFEADGFRLFVNAFDSSDGRIIMETGNGNIGELGWTGTGVFTFGQWNHVAVVVDRPSGQANIYYNGSDLTSDSGILSDFDLSGDIHIGQMYNSIFNLNGNIDDVRIYARALDAEEIAGMASPGTGGTLQVQLATGTPALQGSSLSIDVDGITGGNGTLEYSWDFNDGSPQTPFLTSSSVSHVFTEPGHYPVRVTVRDQQGQQTSLTYLQTIHLPLTSGKPVRSSPIIYDASAKEVWNVNPDNDTVTRIDGLALIKLGEYAVGDHPRTLAQSDDGSIWVVNQDDASISVLDNTDGSVQQTIDLARGSAPYGIAMAPFANTAYVTLEATGQLLEISTVTNTVLRTLDVGPTPRGIAISEDGARLLVTRFVSPANNGVVTEVDAASMTLTSSIALANDPGPDTASSSRGIPNYISSVTISPDGTRAWVPSKKDNTDRGMYRDGQALTFESTVRAIASKIDMSSGLEDLSERIDFDNSALPFAVEFSPLGNWAFVAMAGNNIIDVRDAYSGSSVAGLVTGLTPQGLVLSDDGTALFTHDFMQRSVTVYDVSSLTSGTGVTALPLITVSTVASETLAPDVLSGKQVFYNAADLRMGMDGYISCATCHLDGGQDGRIWDFTDRGEGLRNTIDLRGRAGMGHGNVHWSANFDEIQDFENDIRNFFSGTGFMNALDFANTSDTLGNPKTGLSIELDDMAAYVTSLDTIPDSPHRNNDGSLTTDAQAGRALFLSIGCVSCHDGDRFIDEQRHDVGTILPSSGDGNGLPLIGVGFDTPTLLGLWDTAPYLHDGQAATLEDALAVTGHGNAGSLNSTELSQLVGYLLQIEGACDNAQPGDCDGDGVDNTIDNCLNIANAAQEDTDADGHGNHCDADYDQNCVVSASDLGLFRAAYFTTNPLIDMDGNGVVSGSDLGLFKSGFFAAPGPSAAGALCNP